MGRSCARVKIEGRRGSLTAEGFGVSISNGSTGTSFRFNPLTRQEEELCCRVRDLSDSKLKKFTQMLGF